MPINNNFSNSLGAILAKQSRQVFRAGFENTFRQIQNTVTRRINAEIGKIDEKYDLSRKFEELQRKAEKVEADRQLIEQFHKDNYSNQLRLTDMNDTVDNAIAAYSTDDDDTNLTTAEAESLATYQEELAYDIERLVLTVHEDFLQPYIIRDIKNDLTELRSYTPVAGTVDAAGSGSPTNDNRALLDLLGDLSTKLDTGLTVTQTTVESASQLNLRLKAKLFDISSDQTALSAVELERREAEIENVKIEYANMLKVISISFEVQANTLDQMGTSLEGGKIEPGSVMNLFT